MNIRFYLLYIFILCLSLHSLNAREIKVVTECNQPCKLRLSDALPESLPTDIVLALFNMTKDAPKIHIMPWARAYDNALTEKNVFIYSISRTLKREPLFQWIGDILIERYYIWGLKNNTNHQLALSSDFKNSSFATYRGSNESEYLLQMPNIDLYPVVYPNQRMQMVLRNRIDYFIENEQTLLETCIRFTIDCNKFEKITEVKPLNTPLSIAINKDSDPALIKQYQEAFSVLRASGQLSNLITQWKL